MSIYDVKGVFVNKYGKLVFVNLFINILALIITPLDIYIIINNEISWGHTKEQFIFAAIILFAIQIFQIFYSILNYKYLVKKEYTAPSTAKFLFSFLPIPAFIVTVILCLIVR